eukprot:scaffold22182_cov107-Isochrysis_galbana.AAC.1
MPEHATAPSASNLPDPYGACRLSGRRAALVAHSATPSDSRSLSECAASATSAGEHAATPAAALAAAAPRFTPAPIHVIRCAADSSASSRRCFLPAAEAGAACAPPPTPEPRPPPVALKRQKAGRSLDGSRRRMTRPGGTGYI